MANQKCCDLETNSLIKAKTAYLKVDRWTVINQKLVHTEMDMGLVFLQTTSIFNSRFT